MADAEKHGFNHSVCDVCFAGLRPGFEPARMSRTLKQCCYCGRPTDSGIWFWGEAPEHCPDRRDEAVRGGNPDALDRLAAVVGEVASELRAGTDEYSTLRSLARRLEDALVDVLRARPALAGRDEEMKAVEFASAALALAGFVLGEPWLDPAAAKAMAKQVVALAPDPSVWARLGEAHGREARLREELGLVTAHLRGLIARLDRDGGQAQQGESLEESCMRAGRLIGELLCGAKPCG
jgi:hypothetical protein